MANLTSPTQKARLHHDLGASQGLTVWAVYADDTKQAEYNLARFQLTREQNKNRTEGWVLALLASLLLWALVAVAAVTAVSTFGAVR